MSDDVITSGAVNNRPIPIETIREAVDIVVFSHGPATVEAPEPQCDYPKLCGEHCTYPRYARNGEPTGLVGKVLIQLGFPLKLLLDLDREHEMSELLHPGVKIGRSRNAALIRLGPKGIALLTFFQENQKSGKSWGNLSREAFGPKKLLRRRDMKRRPWRY